jgi:hypothetical protein
LSVYLKIREGGSERREGKRNRTESIEKRVEKELKGQ